MVKRSLIFLLVFISWLIFFVSDSIEEKSDSKFPKSIQMVGIAVPREHGLDGRGVKIGIIDTGIDFNHPDLRGFGPTGKVVGGYDYVNTSEKPIDVNGHGTEVAGIVAADGNFSGMAPKSKLFSYKVSASGESVSSEYIEQAIRRAIDDKVGVINISLGVNKTNNELENAVDQAVSNGVVVVAAAGNNGPDEATIGSPGRDNNVITVGASYNNITSSLVSTLEVGHRHYEVLPMFGANSLLEPIEGKIVYGGYGRVKDLQNLDVNGAILLEQRGSDVKGEKVYFAEKEKNAADRGAKGLIVFNNQTGIFFGDLREPNSNESYAPRIPVISMSKDDGMKLKSLLDSTTTGRLKIFYHPDFVAPFSSRGPVSPFYVKPDLIAPGVFVNTTTVDAKYNLTSGTSVAAPHVTGAVAILLQEHPNLDPKSVSSLIATTTDPVTDAYGNLLPVDSVGSGRLNVTRATSANLIIIPHSLVFNLSYDKPSETKILNLRTISGIAIPKIKIHFSSNESSLAFDYSIDNNVINAQITSNSKKAGSYDGIITVDDSKTTYRIPVIIHVTKGTLMINEKDGNLNFSIEYPQEWTYAKISLIKSDSHDVKVTSVTPQSVRTFPVHETGEYWIEADIKTNNETDYAYQTFTANQVTKSVMDFEDLLSVPPKQIIIISAIVVISIVVGLTVRRK